MVEPVVGALAGLPEPLFIAVNVSGQTLARTAYADVVAASLAAHAVTPSRLHIEVTETMLLAINDAVVRQMHDLADLGCRWYVDDFGTGYSSISHLRDLPVSGLKLDMSFTAGIRSGERTAMQLAGALIGLANGMGLDTVAEGIEAQAEADYLRTVGWRHGQGWLYGKASPTLAI
jgi:EAL domain-containing protein (putative c-di-GMP-specific phosphodiesterase class I)